MGSETFTAQHLYSCTALSLQSIGVLCCVAWMIRGNLVATSSLINHAFVFASLTNICHNVHVLSVMVCLLIPWSMLVILLLLS